MVRSCESLFAAMLAGAAGAVVAGGVLACDGLAAAAAGPGVAGALCVGRLVCAGRTGGFGPKNFAHRMITPKESREATRMRSSGVNLSFCPGTLTSTPQFSRLCLQLNSLASLSISPEPGHIQICAKVDGSAAAVSIPAKSHALRQIVQSPRRHSANKSAQSDSFPQTKLIGRLCRIAAQTALPAQEGISRPLRALQHAHQIRRQRRKLRARYRTLRVNDNVPSCGYLQPVAAHDLAQSPPDPIAHYRTAQSLLDAEAESALRQFIGAEKNCEVGTRTALSGAIDGIKLSAPHQPHFARKQIPVRTPARGPRVPRTIRG